MAWSTGSRVLIGGSPSLSLWNNRALCPARCEYINGRPSSTLSVKLATCVLCFRRPTHHRAARSRTRCIGMAHFLLKPMNSPPYAITEKTNDFTSSTFRGIGQALSHNVGFKVLKVFSPLAASDFACSIASVLRPCSKFSGSVPMNKGKSVDTSIPKYL